jgi:hypothetical protein
MAGRFATYGEAFKSGKGELLIGLGVRALSLLSERELCKRHGEWRRECAERRGHTHTLGSRQGKMTQSLQQRE